MSLHTATIRTVYIARPYGKVEPIKIGCTNNVQKRLKELRPVGGELELLASFPASIDDEHRIQSLFWHDRLEGEWFAWSQGLQILIAAAARGELDIAALPQTRIRKMPEKAAALAAARARRQAARA